MTGEHALQALLTDVRSLQRALADSEREWSSAVDLVGAEHRESARNLVAYWGLRQRELRALQEQLAHYGLSSLGRSEGHVSQTLDAVSAALDALAAATPTSGPATRDFTYGERALRRRAARLFGPARRGRASRIMVTLPSEAAADAALVKEMVQRGMGVARINCAHDAPGAWEAMVAHVRAAAHQTGLSCRVAMDLAGPKLRTGPIIAGPRVLKLKPTRDRTGRPIAPARCLLVADIPVAQPTGIPRIPVPTPWLSSLTAGQTITLRDAREARRRMTVEHRLPDGTVLAASDQTIYLVPALAMHTDGGACGEVGQLPATDQFLLLRRGQLLRLTADLTPADPDSDDPARIGVTLPELFTRLRAGDPVYLDDGKIAAEVAKVEPGAALLRITRAADGGSRLRAGRGINAPHTALPIPALTDLDRSHLPFIAAHADVVELSFVRSPRDVEDLLRALDELGNHRLGVVVKIETVQAFQQLPAILLTAMRRHAAGVMIARGDLAVECGYERMAELQEEILWLCEAGHLPVVWATEVLDKLAKSGRPTRAEITDAAMAGRAECVMLNKGPHVLEAIDTLDDVLRRMSGHAHKKTPLLRPLRSWSIHPR